MTKILLKTMLAALVFGAVPLCGSAKTGAPHTLKANVSFADVALSWEAPAAEKLLKWHDGSNYNGDSGEVGNPQQSIKSWCGAKFSASDLVLSVGEKIEAIDAFQYRQVSSLSVMVYEDGALVAEAAGDPSKFVKNEFQRVPLKEAIEIKAGKEYFFVVCYEHGHNMDFVAIKDRYVSQSGKSDLFSTDGVNWVAVGDGDFLVTAVLSNDVDETPTGYKVYDGESLLTPEAITETTLDLTEQASGVHNYVVEALFAEGNVKSKQLAVETRAYSSYAPAATFGTSSVTDLNVSLEWIAPRTEVGKLTWASTDNVGTAIGGSATTKTKVWVRNQFDANDLIAYAGGKITAINYLFNESVMSQVTAWVMEDDVLIYSEDLAADAVSAIVVGEWTKISLSTPVEIKPGHSYSYGLYVMHTAKAHPMSLDASVGVDGKGNSFSTSSPSSKGFLQTKPSWKTLLSGGINGSWMMTADIEDGNNLDGAITYDLTRDGELVATALTSTSYEDVVDAPGTYVYGLTTNCGGLKSSEVVKKVKVALPAAYAAPLLSDATFDEVTGEISLAWSTDKELTHCGEAAYMVGFEEEMAMMWGAQFSAEELAAYEGLSIDRLKIVIGEAVVGLKVGVYTTTGKVLSEVDLSDLNIEPLYFYSIPLPEPVKITGEEGLIIAYSGTLAAGTSPIILDDGPLVTGGARVSLTGGANWMNLGTINSTYSDYNIVISAMAVSADPEASEVVELMNGVNAPLVVRKVKVVNRSYGIEAAGEIVSVPQQKAAATPKATSFKVYCDDKEIVSTTERQYKGKVPGFSTYTYHVTAIYSNGWESPASQKITVTRAIAQKAKAPYGLTGKVNAQQGVDLTWQAPDAATVLTYSSGLAGTGFGLTGSGTISTYAVIKFPAAELESQVGKRIDHIVFGLLDNNVKSLSIVVVNDENIVYTQSVDVATLVVGENDVRLNEPYVITTGKNVGFGYYVTYASGVKPIACDAGPAVVGYGDIFSKNGTTGYWYSNKTKNNLDWNMHIKAILSTADEALENQAQDASETTYNVYCDGSLVAEGLTSTAYTAAAPAYGTYHVTAVSGGEESGESNLFVFYPAGVEDIIVDDNSDASARYFNLQGVEIKRANAAPGLYIRQSAVGTSKVIIR